MHFPSPWHKQTGGIETSPLLGKGLTITTGFLTCISHTYENKIKIHLSTSAVLYREDPHYNDSLLPKILLYN